MVIVPDAHNIEVVATILRPSPATEGKFTSGPLLSTPFMQRVLGYAALVLGLPLCVAAEKSPTAGMYGFDWLRPKSARCERISESSLKRFRNCEHRTGAFGLTDSLYVCRIDARSEYLIFETKSDCINNLESMKANAP